MLEYALPILSAQRKPDLVEQIQGMLLDMRSIEPTGYLGSVNHLPYEGGVFYAPGITPPISGPFQSEDEFYAAIMWRFVISEPSAFIQLLRHLCKEMPRHDICFTHADLQPKKMMLQKAQEEDGVSE